LFFTDCRFAASMRVVAIVRKVCLIFFVTEIFDSSVPFERAFIEAGFEVEVVRVPNIWLPDLTRRYINDLEAVIRKKKSQGYFVIFCPQSTELFLKEPHLTITYSAYRSWFDAARIRVIPHVWTPVKPPDSLEWIRWADKPRLRIGFMGRSYGTSRLVKVLMKSPMMFKQWLLKGNHLRRPEIIALLNNVKPFTTFNAFPRMETIETLIAKKQYYEEIELDITPRHSFERLEQHYRDYTSHLEYCTYVVCPRGIENYSYRIYEALNRGRIPVIIDTDVVLPKEIDWDQVSIRVPYESLDRIYDMILHDYHSRSDTDFIARQERAFATMAELQAMGWIRNLVGELNV